MFKSKKEIYRYISCDIYTKRKKIWILKNDSEI